MISPVPCIFHVYYTMIFRNCNIESPGNAFLGFPGETLGEITDANQALKLYKTSPNAVILSAAAIFQSSPQGIP